MIIVSLIKDNLKRLEERNCKIEINDDYIVLYSKNGFCKPLKKGDKLVLNNQNILNTLKLCRTYTLKNNLVILFQKILMVINYMLRK